ncbi:FKBP-type peptidyl-prolyl cis-trans isomerase [Rothia sp. CCM 9418]|uniref:FKBP-type peptidyl-prolyl cis-trans isomerase n=1 Tax=unclassified Rothia (in: high G+C Gram-positive bacteria) TaxID=2689056 RepID=UPI003AC201B6
MPKKIVLTTAGIVLSLALSACSGGSDNNLDKVSYDLKDATAAPSVSFATPFSVGKTETHLISEGDGDSVKDGDTLLIQATIFDGKEAKELGTTYESKPLMILVGEKLKENAPELYSMLTEHKVGSSFSYSTNVVSSESGASPSTAPADSPTNVEVYTVVQKLLPEATGKALDKKDWNKALESFDIADSGAGVIKLKDDRGDAPKELVTQDLIEGSGRTVESTDQVYVKYEGVRWEDGKSFDGNYNGDPLDISLGGVIKGWKEGLSGHKVGSRVLLIIPPELAYGENPASGAPSGALVFVVDILGAMPTPEAVIAQQKAAEEAHQKAEESKSDETPAPAESKAEAPAENEPTPEASTPEESPAQ